MALLFTGLKVSLLDATFFALLGSPIVPSILYTRRKSTFKGAKTRMFWVGLTISGLASVALFLTIWVYLTTSRAAFHYRNMVYPVPPIVGCIVFLLVGLYMMKSGTE